MNEFENKGIEKFFRSKLKPGNQKNNWSSPPDFIFEKAIDQVNSEKKDKNRKLIFWLSLFGFVMILSFIILIQSKQLKDVKKSMDKLEDKLITSQLNQQVNISDDLKSDNDNSEASVIENKLTHTSAQYHKPISLIQKNTPTTIYQTQTFRETNQPFTLQKNEITEDQGNTELTDHFQLTPPFNYSSQANKAGLYNSQKHASTTIDHSARAYFQFNVINALSLTAFDIEYSKLLINPQFVDILHNDSVFKKGWTLALTGGKNEATFLMGNMSSLDGRELTDYNKYYSGLQSEFSLRYEFTSRFSAGVHANYYNINNHSTFKENSNFDMTNMRFVDGKLEYSMPMDIFTPIGSHKMNSELIFDENLNTSNLITNQSDIKQSIHSIGIGISARYSFIQKSKFSSFIGASFTHHLSNKTNSEFQTTITMEDKVMKEFNTIPHIMTDKQNTFNSVSAQLGIEYSIALKTKISFQTSFGKSINSLRQINIETDPHTHLQYFNTAIGISYSL